MFSFAFPPKGWAFCAGQILSIQQNSALFSLLGTQYGGNGVSTFALPDLRGRVPAHVGNGMVQGELGGVDSVSLLLSQLPSHGHGFNVANDAPTVSDPTNHHLARSTTAYGFAFGSAPGAGLMSPTNLTGGNQPHDNHMPTIVMNYCIALQGIFPSRN